MVGFVRTGTVLDEILENTRLELSARKLYKSLTNVTRDAESAPPPRDWSSALQRETVALIAEVKHASPSRGVLIEPFDPVALALIYAQNGAAAISVLTDERFFQGKLEHLHVVHSVVNVPTLRKDFVIDPYQIFEARAAGADAILLIVAALADSQLVELYDQAVALGMSVLVEVHNEVELERALRIKPAMIGINNRDLKTFQIDTGTTERLAPLIPKGMLVVAESGIHNAEDVYRMGQAGADAVLVGEGLVTASDIAAQVKAFSSQPKEQRG
jgi:indole-3-glycerol phosphate synthase